MRPQCVSTALAIAASLFLGSCRSAGSLPPLPVISTASFVPSIREEVEAAVAQAKARPNDAAAVGHLGMVLHAHEQLESARQCYQRAALLEPKRFDWRYYLGVV